MRYGYARLLPDGASEHDYSLRPLQDVKRFTGRGT